MDKLFSPQLDIINYLHNLRENRTQYIFIVGKQYSGKSTAVKYFFSNSNLDNLSTLVFDRSEVNDDPYAPFRKAARKSTKKIDDLTETIFKNRSETKLSTPLAFIESIINIGKRKNAYPYFTEDEEQLLSQIHRNLRRQPNSNNYFLFEEINTWDKQSLILVKKLIEHGEKSYPLIHKATLILTLSTNAQIDEDTSRLIQVIQNKCRAKIFELPNLNEQDFRYLVDDFEKNQELLNDQDKSELLEFLHSHSDDNLEEIPYIIKEVSTIMQRNSYGVVKKFNLYNTLKDKLSYSNISLEKSEEILEYASLMGSSFSKAELQLLTNLTPDEFQTVIDRVTDIKIIKKIGIDIFDNYKFAFCFFQELFRKQASCNSNKYYTRLEEVVNKLYPYKYLRRANYLSYVKEEAPKVQKLYFLSLLSNLRNNEEFDPTVQTKLTQENRELLELFEDVYDTIRNSNYASAINSLNTIKTMTGDIAKRAEADILLAMCFSKTIDPKKRKESIVLLEKYIGNDELQSIYADIYERILMRLFVMYIHVSELDKANEIYETLLERLELYSQNNTDASIKRHILFRMANTKSNEQISLRMIGIATDFFKKNQHHRKGIVNYFISLCNFSGTQIENGEYSHACQTVKIAQDLIESHPTIQFPRSHILLNNYLLSSYFTESLTAVECIKEYERITLTMPKNAERLFLISNLSIFYALIDDFKTAYKILSDESKSQIATEDAEGKYNSRVSFNLAIYQFLMGNEKDGIDNIKSYLSSLSQTIGSEKERDLKRAKDILEKMKSGTVYNGEQWLEVLLKDQVIRSVKNSQTVAFCDNYRRLGYMFTSLYNWDI